MIKEWRLPGHATPVWQRIQPSDGDTPWDALARKLKEVWKLSARPDFTATATQLRDLLVRHLDQGQELILFVDQLEELFIRGFKEPDIREFLEQLLSTAQDQMNRLRVVATIRSEFLGKLEAYESTLTLLNGPYRYHLGPVSPRMLQDMIEKPAEVTKYDKATEYKYEFEQGLVERIVDDTGQEPGNLPLVAYALNQLFERQNDGTFTVEAYDAMGGVVGAIATKADDALSKLTDEVRGAFDTVFSELVHLERERPPTRSRPALSRFTADQAAIQLIEALTGQDCRVLVKSGHESDTVVEVAHEKLFSAWPTLKDWIDKSGEDLRLIDYAEEAARRWHETGNDLRELWIKERAEETQRALTRFKKPPSDLLHTMLQPRQMLIERLNDASLSHQDRVQIGQKLAEFGDLPPGVGLGKDGLPDIDWAEIPGGLITLEEVNHVFEVKKPFRLAKYPVTNMQFQSFIDAGGYEDEQWWQGIKKVARRLPQWSEGNGPREIVSWFEAVAFCQWLSVKTGTSVRLPTEWEWQQAATGGAPAHEYPWEGKWDNTRCNSAESRLGHTTAVGLYPRGATQHGVLDMAGNVWEWCMNTYENPERLELVGLDDSGSQRVIRGGSWGDTREGLRTSSRYRFIAGFRSEFIGFRLAQDLP